MEGDEPCLPPLALSLACRLRSSRLGLLATSSSCSIVFFISIILSVLQDKPRNQVKIQITFILPPYTFFLICLIRFLKWNSTKYFGGEECFSLGDSTQLLSGSEAFSSVALFLDMFNVSFYFCASMEACMMAFSSWVISWYGDWWGIYGEL